LRPTSAALPPRRKSLPKKRRGDAARFESAALCSAIMKDGCACGARALNPATRQRYSKELGYEVPAGLCRTHVKWHARAFHQIEPTYEFQRAKLCGKLTYKSGRTLPCRNPCMHGASSCHIHGGRGAAHGYKGVGPWNSEGGKLAWAKQRASQDGAYRNQPKFKNVRVKREDRPSYAHLLNRRLQRQPQPARTLSDLDQQEFTPPRRKLGPLYPA
jgi:hypothetical protein